MHYLGQWGGGGPGHSWALKWHQAKRVPFAPMKWNLELDEELELDLLLLLVRLLLRRLLAARSFSCCCL